MKSLKGFRSAWEHCIGSYGFAMLVTICVAVIAATALWTRQSPSSATYATPPAGDGVNAASLWQQTLPAETPTALPSAAPLQWFSPLSGEEVLQGFSGTQMLRSPATGLWEVHHAVDLAAEAGTPVTAIADGRVTDCAADAYTGTWIEITHADGSVSRYASLALLGAFRKGDAVRAGQTIGFVGNTHQGEKDLGPHLHLEVFVGGEAIDPLSLFQDK